MENLIKPSRFFYSLSIAVFGIQQLICRDFLPTLMPVPRSVPGGLAGVYGTAVIFIVAAFCISVKIKAKLIAILLGILLFLLVLGLHLPMLVNDPHNGGLWTAAFELLSLSGGAFILAETLPAAKSDPFKKIIRSGRYFFAAALLIFGIQHFMYASYISGLVPAWIPWKLFWSYFVGVAFIAAAISIFTGAKTRLATKLVGTLFLVWVLIVHAPRVGAASHNEDEWTSAFVALAMSGIAFMLAAIQPRAK